ncbi:dal80p-controlled protein [Lithohypha guttulata]|uniref:Dal80p-controlled protein n=1 Tax=Lithohypha guttulata TaxID=1690604 RepID=A0AAN7T4L9_9EURO|nr:dal80p-controlled protein [Lithohypha guttulata]
MSVIEDVPVRILVVNPNTSEHMTKALQPVIDDLGFKNVQYTLFTSPTPGISSINSPDDATESAKACLSALVPMLPMHDAFLVACYSQHPLVPQLKHECDILQQEATKGAGGAGARKYVTGIFEASVVTSLALTGSNTNESFGIVSTGKIWETALRDAVHELFGVTNSKRFAGCQTTGLNASELHDLPAEEVRTKMKDATKRLLQDGTSMQSHVRAICLGCAGMIGLEEAVREACLEELGEEDGKKVAIVDGVKAGIGALLTLARGGF